MEGKPMQQAPILHRPLTPHMRIALRYGITKSLLLRLPPLLQGGDPVNCNKRVCPVARMATARREAPPAP